MKASGNALSGRVKEVVRGNGCVSRPRYRETWPSWWTNGPCLVSALITAVKRPNFGFPRPPDRPPGHQAHRDEDNMERCVRVDRACMPACQPAYVTRVCTRPHARKKTCVWCDRVPNHRPAATWTWTWTYMQVGSRTWTSSRRYSGLFLS